MIGSNTTMQCQQCAGTVSAVPGREYLQCDYCSSLVFATDNPLTVDRIVSTGRHLEMADCPVCSAGLATGKIENRPVLYCSHCYGLLIRTEHFGAIVRERRARRADSDSESGRQLNTDEYRRKISCPNCHDTMEVHPYYGPGNIVIDSCFSCQYIWLDHGELRTVERAGGGAEPRPMPIHVNDDGELTVVPPPPSASPAGLRSGEASPLSQIADLIFGL